MDLDIQMMLLEQDFLFEANNRSRMVERARKLVGKAGTSETPDTPKKTSGPAPQPTPKQAPPKTPDTPKKYPGTDPLPADKHPIVSPASQKKQGMSWKKKAAIGAGVGLAAYGAYKYMKNRRPNPMPVEDEN